MAMAPLFVVTPVTPSTVPTVRPEAPPLPRNDNVLPDPVTSAASVVTTLAVVVVEVAAIPRSSITDPTLRTAKLVAMILEVAACVMVPPDRNETVPVPAVRFAPRDIPPVPVFCNVMLPFPPALVVFSAPLMAKAEVATGGPPAAPALNSNAPPLVVILLLTAMLFPACMVMPMPLLFILIASVTVMLLVACRTTFAAALLIVMGETVQPPAAQFGSPN